MNEIINEKERTITMIEKKKRKKKENACKCIKYILEAIKILYMTQ